MAENINRSQRFLDELRSRPAVSTKNIDDERASVKRSNKFLSSVKSELVVKEKRSQVSAKKVQLTN